jgi:hypothetical protein
LALRAGGGEAGPFVGEYLGVSGVPRSGGDRDNTEHCRVAQHA